MKIKSNFVYPTFKDTDFHFGSGELKGVPLREDGDWRDYVPQGEEQKRNGVESSACFVEAQLHAISTIQEEQYGIVDQDFSDRFTLIYSNGSPYGGSPLDSAAAVRNKGVIPESMLPFSGDIVSWDEFNSFKGGNEKACITAGKLWLKRWSPYNDIVFRREETIENKYRKLREALKYSPVPMSVAAWYRNADGLYYKPDGAEDNHMVVCIYVDSEGCPYILDTYGPIFIKKLTPYFDSEFAMRWVVLKKPEIKVDDFWILLKKLFSYFT